MSACRPGLAAIVAVCFCLDAYAARPAPPPMHPPALTKEAPKPPWRRRRRTGVKGMIPKDAGLIDLNRWPLEPTVVPPYDVERFVTALRDLCGHLRLPERQARRYTTWILQYASQFGVDPFTLAAVVYRQSRCDEKAKGDYGIGLTRIHPRMHAEHLVKHDGRRSYRYHVLGQAPGGAGPDASPAWSERILPIDKFRFTHGGLRMAERNLYFAAALLSIHKQQCPANDGVFGSVPHRHYVSHYFWGDKVRGAGAEDRTLMSRRRLIRYYDGPGRDAPPAAAKAEFEGQPIHPPLDGFPRKVSSEMGALRAGGARLHMGIDFESSQGEPVRAVATGRVAIAGLDRKKGGSRSLKPEHARLIPNNRMGPGGLYVMINHAGGLQSAYMHLSEYQVRTGQRVAAGEIIGWVGRTGIKSSGAHLHFELRKDHKHINPLPVLRPYLFELEATWRGRRVAIEDRRVRKRWRRTQRRLARAAAKEKARLAREAESAGTH